MLDILCQRHRDRRQSFCPPDPINTREYEVAEISRETARVFVVQHHYSGTFPAARICFGLFWHGVLVGVAVFSQPPSQNVLADMPCTCGPHEPGKPCPNGTGVELGRFVLVDGVKGNGESWMLARCFELLRQKGIEVLLSHSDPVPRRTLDGRLVLPGHVGIIYQATNAIYANRTRPQLLCLMPDGKVFSERSMSKIRSAERGWERDVGVLLALGAPPADHLVSGGKNGDPRWCARRDWMWTAIAATCRRIEHGGNHRYLWALTQRKSVRQVIAAMACGKPYPKQRDSELLNLTSASDTTVNAHSLGPAVESMLSAA